MQMNLQDRIITELEEKLTNLKKVLEDTIEKHSDAAFDLKDLKHSLKELSGDKFDSPSEKMLVMATEWEDVK